MPYFVVDDWRGGLDLRRMAAVASPTTLRKLSNGHINEGGEVERRKAFVTFANAAGTVGLASANALLYVFGTGPSPLAGGSPLQYQQLVPGGGVAVVGIEDWDLFDGLLYVIAMGSDGNRYHFYNGVLVPGGVGKHFKTFGSKVYSVLGKDVRFTATGVPTDWAGVGSGTINLSTEDADSLDLEGIEIYFDQLAFFSPGTIQLWNMDPDPLLNRKAQILRASGTLAGQSARQFGSGDVLYLDSSGVRSLRARDSSNAASVSDIGSPIDVIMRQLQTDDPLSFARAHAAIEQGTGRFWLRIGADIYVLSHFPGPKVTAWSTYTPENGAQDMISHDRTIAIRTNDDQIQLYGGEGFDTFDSSPLIVTTPFLTAQRAGTDKEFEALDIAGRNLWKVECNLNPASPDSLNDESQWLLAGQYDGITYSLARMALGGQSTHIAFRLTCTSPGEAVLANLTFHFKERGEL